MKRQYFHQYQEESKRFSICVETDEALHDSLKNALLDYLVLGVETVQITLNIGSARMHPLDSDTQFKKKLARELCTKDMKKVTLNLETFCSAQELCSNATLLTFSNKKYLILLRYNARSKSVYFVEGDILGR